MVVYEVVHQGQAYRYPHEAKEDAKPLLEHLRDHGKEGVDVDRQDDVHTETQE